MHKKEERISEINYSDSMLYSGLPAYTVLSFLSPVYRQLCISSQGEEKLNFAEKQKQIMLVC